MTLAMPSLADGHLEREQLLVTQLALARCGPAPGSSPPSARPCPTMCLPRGDHAMGEVGALEGLDVRDPERRGEVRVLAVCLLDPSPARIARDVEDRRERMAGAGQEHPAANGGRHRRDDAGVEARGGADRLLEARRGPRDQAVQALLVDDRRDTEPRLLDEVVLDLRSPSAATSTGRRLVEPASRVIWPMPFPASCGQPIVVEAGLVDDLERPERPELRDLLLAGHPGEQVGHARIDRQRRVPVPRRRRGHQPFTAPPVRPPTMCRSAIM